MRWHKLGIVLVLCVLPEPAPAWKADVVKAWARSLGDELWRLNEALTKSDQIRIRYKQMNASVKKKDGKQILESALRSVSTMLTRKINAVKCIHSTAERLAAEFNYTKFQENDTFEYCSAKYSNFITETGEQPQFLEKRNTPSFAVENPHYSNISLEKDSHFYEINVNTNISCVHVPTNIYYLEYDAINAIMWSKDLNEVFIKNYQSDPSLSWQYFGSAHGILRFYPAMPWPTESVDTYDARVKSWYIEAATCSKDVIILFDVSGSMTGFKNYVARRTLKSLLETLSNNDHVNVYMFSKNTTKVVACFKDLVQATPENIQTIIDALEPTDGGKKPRVPLEGYANLTTAYRTAFETLKMKRKDCNVSSTQGCNQLVMLITDYVPGNLTEVFDEYNRETVSNKTYIPVRVFTYLIGKEVTNVNEIEWMACSNRGIFVHIHSVEEVQQQVLKYINVIARPMILEGKPPLTTWTHANMDYTRTKNWAVSSDIEKPDEDKLVTSVAIPAFDFKYNRENNDAMLLGVAGTDVPIDSIAKLAQPHQLGVNGYSFIVSNNGYLLLHPLLITSINGDLQKNYNSVDFVEVEQVDDGKGPRELGEKIKMLREKLVNGDDGDMINVEVLFHYDNMRRIARVKHNYFFQQLEGTPFSMGISLPRGYGDTELLLRDNPLEAKQGQDIVGVNVTDYFRTSFRVHPDWVYCKYHYLEGHESVNAEHEIWKFLALLSENKMDIMRKQYPETEEKTTQTKDECADRRQLEKDDYYCNDDLVKQLVFDAKLSDPYFKDWIATDGKKALAEKYNVSVRFIATSSGLTRWHYIRANDSDKNEIYDDFGYRTKGYDGKVFGDDYHNAIEETWYKAAVLQHIINKESIVISTQLPILDETIKNKPPVLKDNDTLLTSSYAIFYKDGDSETPASVVGFQFMYSSFNKSFMDITRSRTIDNERSVVDAHYTSLGHNRALPDSVMRSSGNATVDSRGNNGLSCDSDEYDCYIIDSSGYIVFSVDINNIGTFFGEKHPHVLKSFINESIYDHVEVFNYQALCPVDMIPEKNCGWLFKSPFSIVGTFFRWLLTETIILMSDVFSWNFNYFAYSHVIVDDDDYSDVINIEYNATTPAPEVANDTETAKNKEKEGYFSCDHRISLYILNQSYFKDKISPVIHKDEESDCYPAYWASYVPKTNLLLVVVKKDWVPHPSCEVPPTTKPEPTTDSTSGREPCHKLDLGSLPRRRLEGCYTYHDEEVNITTCNKGISASASALLLSVSAFVAFASKMLL